VLSLAEFVVQSWFDLVPSTICSSILFMLCWIAPVSHKIDAVSQYFFSWIQTASIERFYSVLIDSSSKYSARCDNPRSIALLFLPVLAFYSENEHISIYCIWQQAMHFTISILSKFDGIRLKSEITRDYENSAFSFNWFSLKRDLNVGNS
jgi:hypothetical protein